MGGGASINYCIPVTQKPEGETSIYRNPLKKDQLYGSPTEQLTTMKAILLNTLKEYGNNPALGTFTLTQGKSSPKITSLLSNISPTKKQSLELTTSEVESSRKRCSTSPKEKP